MTLTETEWNDLSEYRDSLEHYGVKGMKWGVRKEPERTGRKRIASAEAKEKGKSRMSYLDRKRKAKAQKRSEKIQKQQQAKQLKEIKRRESILRNPTRLYKHRYEFTQEEINAALKNFEWEKKLQDYSINQLQAGKKYLEAAFTSVNAGINFYNAAARIANTMNPDSLPYIPTIKGKKDKKKDEKNDD